jgi:hypothetical protein
MCNLEPEGVAVAFDSNGPFVSVGFSYVRWLMCRPSKVLPLEAYDASEVASRGDRHPGVVR